MNHSHMITNHALAKATKHWKYVAPLLTFPQNESDYNLLVAHLDELLELVGNNENHPLIGLIDAISNLITSYEETYIEQPKGKGIDALKFLMKAHNLRQSDLSEIASQGVMSEILKEKRALNIRQIRLLAQRFHVDPSTFIDK